MKKKNVEQTEYHTETLKKWTPSFMLKIGVTLNIIFCALLSIPIVTLPLTITAIVLNALLLIPRVDTKRYHAFWKYIPVALTIFLVAIVWFIVFFSVTSLEGLLNDFLDFIETYIIFWDRNAVDKEIVISGWLKVFEISLLVFGTSGSIFIIFGWYWGKEIGSVQVKNKTPKRVKNNKKPVENDLIVKDKSDKSKEKQDKEKQKSKVKK